MKKMFENSLRKVFTVILFFVSLFSIGPTAHSTRSSSRGRYDKSISLFDPEGDILQIRYADRAGENGMTLVCIVTSDNSVVLCSPSAPSNSLMDRRCIDKVSQVDEGIWIAFSGLAGDGRHITRRARQYCNNYLAKFGCRPTVAALANHVGSLQHEASVKGVLHQRMLGERPLGLHVLCVGFDEALDETEGSKSKGICTPVIFVSKSSGAVTQWRAVAIGKEAEKAILLLENRVRSPINEEEATKVAVQVITRVSSTETTAGDDSTATVDTYILQLDHGQKQTWRKMKTLKRIHQDPHQS